MGTGPRVPATEVPRKSQQQLLTGPVCRQLAGRQGRKTGGRRTARRSPSSARLFRAFRVPSRIGGNRGITTHGLKPPPRKTWSQLCFTRPPSAALHTRLQEQKPGQEGCAGFQRHTALLPPAYSPCLLPPAPVGPPPRTSRTRAKTKLQPAAAELAWIPPPPLPALAPRPGPRSQSLSFLIRTAGTIRSPLRAVARFQLRETGDETWRHTAGHRVS